MYFIDDWPTVGENTSPLKRECECRRIHRRNKTLPSNTIRPSIFATINLPHNSCNGNMSEIVLRDARYSELPEIAHVMATAFWEDNLFGQIIHPHRNEHPGDVDLYWLRRARVNFWDYRWKWLVAVAKDEAGREVIAGIAQWTRLGDGGKKLEGSYLDPRNLLMPLSSVAMKIQTWAWPSRASDPRTEDIIERTYPYFDTIWTGKRAESWYLEALAVRPDFQGKSIGRKLVQWDLDQAEAEGVCASVVSALGKDDFYTKCGFDEQYGSARHGPLADIEGANMFWKWPKTNS
ncbi:acyl-CoA N-acyltransferase [Dactylonectria estremocensis]|uniref:Acyl-CoA N-acyltransferase n=1 Tax=Dactylonectria estremocensis TaxID=1079267 RepID=A0A9P9D6X1_9HYPO|nr:acyl-CoA N-acyltransferase [Dactylonectria estremocensis]